MKLPGFILLSILCLPLANSGFGLPESFFKSTDTYVENWAEGFQYYNEDQRLAIFSEIIRKLQMDYSTLLLKEKYLKKSIKDLAKEVYRAEKQVKESKKLTDLEYAELNLKFFDRLRKFVSQFHDSHLPFALADSIGYVHSGIKLVKVTDGHNKSKYIIGPVNQGLIDNSKKLNPDDAPYDKVVEGVQIISIDGLPIKYCENNLENYVKGSSGPYRSDKALEAVTTRNFRFPSEAYYTLRFTDLSGSPQTVKMYWVYKNTRTDLKIVLENLNIPRRYTEISYTDSKTPSIPKLDDEITYTNSSGTPILKTGSVDGDAAIQYGYVGIYSFPINQKLRSKEDDSGLFSEILEEYLTFLNEYDHPLILDLTKNSGGNLFTLKEIMELFSQDDSSPAGNSSIIRLSPSTRAQLSISDKVSEKSPQYSQASSYQLISRPDTMPAFSHPIVVLIGPWCVSACDIFVRYLKDNKLATIIGGATNGTGAGYSESGGVNPKKWIDSFGLVKLGVPNFLFGTPQEEKLKDLSTSEIQSIITENKPVQPDIEYKTTWNDYMGKSNGLIKLAKEVISKELKSKEEEKQAPKTSSVSLPLN